MIDMTMGYIVFSNIRYIEIQLHQSHVFLCPDHRSTQPIALDKHYKHPMIIVLDCLLIGFITDRSVSEYLIAAKPYVKVIEDEDSLTTFIVSVSDYL